MAEDAVVLSQIRALIDERTTYAYQRVTALVNGQRSEGGIDHKRVYCPMLQDNLLLAQHTGKPRDGRTHDRKVITIRSNLRWSSDGFEIRCWDGAVVRVTFVIDTCDRQILAWGSTTGGFDGQTVRDLMVPSLERRFGQYRTPPPVQWLTGNASCYTAKETLAFADQLGLLPCVTPVCCPQSSGMAEAFVKTFKRDYVHVHDCPDAKTVLAQLNRWFDDYNDSQPCKGFKMKSRREFIRANLAAGPPIRIAATPTPFFVRTAQDSDAPVAAAMPL